MMDYILRAVVLVCFITGLCVMAADVDETIFMSRPEWDSKLYNNLTSNYHTMIPPTAEGPIQIILDLVLISFDFIDEANEMVLVQAWSKQLWYDSHLKWDPKSNNNTEEILLSKDQIWIPDIELISSGIATTTLDTNPYVLSSGWVLYVPCNQIQFACRMNFRFFPYDKQQCNLKFGSWMYTSDTINMTTTKNATVDLRWFEHANDFELISTKAVRSETVLSCCPDYYWPDITFSINMKRISSAYSVKLVLPAVLTGFLILATFLLPPASYEKITLCGLIFIALLLQLIYLHDIIPASGNTILGEYLAFALFIDFFAVISAVVSYNINNRMKEPSLRESGEEAQSESDSNDLKRLVPKGFKEEWLQYWDVANFAVFSILFIVGLAIVLGRRG